MPDTVPSTPTTPIAILLGTAIRAILLALGSFGVAWAEGVTGDQITLIVSALVALVAVLWSFGQKIYAAWREHQIAVLSATSGRAVQPEKVVP